MTTLAAIQGGSFNYILVAVIEGHPDLITDGEPAAAIAAWAGTDFTTAIGGLHLELGNEQRFDPWNPLRGGGRCTMRVLDVTDSLGIAMGRTQTTPETELTASLDRDDTAIAVKRSDDFPAATSEAYIGNECFEYSAKPSTNAFTASKRGKYSPFAGGGAGVTRWARDHRVGTNDQYTALAPLVTRYRRTWKGALVGVWMHRVTAGVADTKANAQLVFAGELDEFADAPDGCVVIHCRHVLDVVKNAVIGRDQYRAKIGAGIYLSAGMTIVSGWDMTVVAGVATKRTVNPLVVIASGAAVAYNINAGYYSAQELIDKINIWIDAERAAARAHGEYSLSLLAGTTAAGVTVHFLQKHARFSNTTADANFFLYDVHERVAIFFGYPRGFPLPGQPLDPYHLFDAGTGIAGATNWSQTQTQPIRRTPIVGSLGLEQRWTVTEEVGTFFDQSGYMPAEYAAAITGNAIGIFVMAGKHIILGRISGGEFRDGWGAHLVDEDPSMYFDDSATVEIVQIYALNASFYGLIQLLFKSTGTSAYNDASYDVFPSGLGLALPDEIMGASFDNTLNVVPGFAIDETMWILKPTKLTELISADLVLRGAFLIWRNGKLEWSVWSTPIAANALFALTEANKAKPSGHEIEERSVRLESAEWAKPIVKISYDWDPIEDKYARDLTLQDRVAVDDEGGHSDIYTLKCRNFGRGIAAEEAIKRLVSGETGGDIGFVAKWIPLASRPVGVVTRSISSRFFEGYAPGDTVTITDNHARDPATGVRNVTARPGMISRIAANFGGRSSPARGANPAAGEVDVIVIATNRATVWSPAGEIDETASSGGFTNGINATFDVIRLKAHHETEASEAADASHFQGGDQILITEIDPTTPGSPLQWSRLVHGTVVGNDLELDAPIAAPAWDATKLYRVTSAPYTTAQVSQQTDAYEADDADAMIVNVSPPYQYGIPPLDAVVPAAASHTELMEYIATSSYGDGAAHDVGNHRAIARTVNNLIDHRTAHQSPALGITILTNTTYAGYQIRAYTKKFFCRASYSLVQRLAAASVWARSATGASVSVRLTLSANLLTGLYLNEIGASTPGYAWQAPYSQVEWTGITSTTWATTAEKFLNLRVLDNLGTAWLAIELTQNAECRGLAQLCEKERT